MTTYSTDPTRTFLSLLMQPPCVLSASAVTWAQISCGIHTLSASTYAEVDLTQPAIVFAEDGTAQQGSRSWFWTAPIYLNNWDTSLRIRVAKVLDPACIEAQRWRLVQEYQRRMAASEGVFQTVLAAGPVRGTYGNGDAERMLLCRPTMHREEPALSFGSARGDEVLRDDLASLYFRSEDARRRAARAVAFASEALRYALLRHLAMVPKVGALAPFVVNGRGYWLQGGCAEDGTARIPVWNWLSFPETEVSPQTFGVSAPCSR